jgi:prohibitin 2
MAQQGKDAINKILKNSKGAGIGIGLVAVAGVTAYAAVNSIFTGIFVFWGFFTNSYVLVEAGHRAIMFNRIGGLGNEIYKEGLHFRIPWFQYPIVYDIRARPNQIRSPTGSKDLQMVNIGLRVLSRPEPNSLPKIYRTLGLNWEERVLPSICNEVSIL